MTSFVSLVPGSPRFPSSPLLPLAAGAGRWRTLRRTRRPGCGSSRASRRRRRNEHQACFRAQADMWLVDAGHLLKTTRVRASGRATKEVHAMDCPWLPLAYLGAPSLSVFRRHPRWRRVAAGILRAAGAAVAAVHAALEPRESIPRAPVLMGVHFSTSRWPLPASHGRNTQQNRATRVAPAQGNSRR